MRDVTSVGFRVTHWCVAVMTTVGVGWTVAAPQAPAAGTTPDRSGPVAVEPRLGPGFGLVLRP